MNSKVRIGVSRPTWMLACLGFALLGMLSLQSCKKEYFQPDRIKDATWNPELAVPLIKSTITVPEVLSRFDDQDIIVVDTTEILALRYFDNIFSIAADSLIRFQDQQDQQSYPLSAGDAVVLLGGNTVSVPPFTYNVAFDMSNMNPQPEVETIEFKGGNLVVDVAQQFSYPTTVRVQIPGLTLAGVGFDQTVAGGSQLVVGLAGRTLTMTPINQIPVTATITISGSSGAGAPGQTVTVTASMQGIEFATITGDMKQQQIAQSSGEVRIRFFENDGDGEITWADPRVKAIFTNGVGAGVQLNVTQLDFESSSGTQGLTGPISPPNQPVIGFNPLVGGLLSTIFDLNRTNSNIVTVAASKPTKLYYAFSGLMNPGGSANTNWLKDTSKVRLDMEVFLPFDGTAKGFRRSDTADVDIFPLNDDIEEIESVTFRMTIDNGFPADAHAQVYFYDSTLSSTNPGVLIDSLFPDARAVVFSSPVVPPAPNRIDQDNKKRTVLDITLDRAKLEKLEAMGFRKLVSRGWIDTYQLGTTNVQIYQEYETDLYLGVMVKAKVNVQL